MASAVAFASVAAFAVFAAPHPGGFSHEMPKATNEKPLDTPYGEMAEVFGNPFGRVQTGCYWYWIAGHVSCEGVKRDLEAMKRAGIDRPCIGDIADTDRGRQGQGSAKIFSPEWKGALQTAFKTAKELGIELGIFNCPGWSQSGGPWVTPDQAMRRFVASSLVVEGPRADVKLPMPVIEKVPSSEMRDVLVVAYPLPDGFTGRLEAKDISLVEKTRVVELESPEPFLAQSAEVTLSSGTAIGKVSVEAEADGAWRLLRETPFSRANNSLGFAPHSPVVLAFAPTAARRFRVTVRADSLDKVRLSSVAVCAASLVEKAFEKSFAKMYEFPLPTWNDYKWPVQPAGQAGSALDPSKAVVLRGKIAPDGTLDWKIPPGKWVIYRIGAAPTGSTNGPANPGGNGREIDKMSREHIASHFDAFVGKILDETPSEDRGALRHCILDSWERSGQNFSNGFEAKFKASFGYDPTPYLPTLFGMSVADRDTSDRFLWDLRRLVADEVAYSYAGGLRKAANARGLETWLENYGHWGFPGEFLQYGGQSDGVSGEFWSEGDLGSIENRAASSCAHVYGKRLVWAESQTAVRSLFRLGPADMKQRLDRFFTEGINATMLHVYVQQADERKPGRVCWFGNEFNRHNTWFEHFDLFTGYLKRCGWMLRQGLNVADIAYFIGEDAPCMTGVCDPALPPGRQFDYINAEVLKETASVDEKGRIVLPHGTAYEVLVLPKLETMRPEMLVCIERLVNAGAFVLGPKPLRSPSLAGQPQSDAKVGEVVDRLWGEVDGANVKVAKRGNGTIAWGLSLEEALKVRGSAVDVAFDAKFKLAYAHRTMPNVEIYFISNQSGTAIDNVEVSFRDGGARTPELWDAATGRARARPSRWREENGHIIVTLSLAKHESVFVVFPKRGTGNGEQGTGGSRSCATANTDATMGEQKHILPVEIAGPWTVSFESDAIHRGPKEPIVIDRLFDLSTSTNSAIKHYSGKIVYKTTFNLSTLQPSTFQPLILDLGEVSVTAKVKVNGKYVGGVCFTPYRLDITQFAKAGENDLEVEVCNLWVNRLLGDEGDSNRQTWTSIPCCDKNTKLPKSGLTGPVSIR